MGFSVVNFVNHAHSSARRSGGKNLSMKLWPLFRAPVTVPWRAPVMPPTSSAMVQSVDSKGTRIGKFHGERVTELKGLCGISVAQARL